MLGLKDTVGAMLSPDWKERFAAEYWQLSIRILRLAAYIEGSMDVDEAVERQLAAMIEYQDAMFDRARHENIDLELFVDVCGDGEE